MKDVNFKSGTKIRSENDEIILDFKLYDGNVPTMDSYINNHTTTTTNTNIISPSSSYNSITPLQQQYKTTVEDNNNASPSSLPATNLN